MADSTLEKTIQGTDVLQYSRSKRFFKIGYFYGLTYIMNILRLGITKEFHLHDKENVLKNKELTSQPCLWLFKHETTYDAVNIAPIWRRIASTPYMEIITKRFNEESNLAEKIFYNSWKPFLIEVDRPTRGEGETEKERGEMVQENKEKFEMIRSNYPTGAHILMMPEGTTETDGRVSLIKPGCYELSTYEHEGRIVKVNQIPAGLTYDPFSSTKKTKNLVFVHFGKPFVYEKAYDDVKLDMIEHTSRVRAALINCNTITTAQLAGEYIIKRAMEGESEISHALLQKVVAARVEELRKLGGLVFDPALENEKKREKRVTALYGNLGDYLVGENEVNIGRVLLKPRNNVVYKKENLFKYCTNRMIQVSDRMPPIKAILDETRAQIL